MRTSGSRRPGLKHLVEYSAVRGIGLICKLLPVDVTSNFFGTLARIIGPRLGYSRRIHMNLDHVFPDLPSVDRRKIVRGTWENLARAANDYCQFGRICRQESARLEIIGGEHLDRLRDSGRSSVLFSAHIGYWESIPLAARRHGLPLGFLSRPMNNQLVYELLSRWQSHSGVKRLTRDRDGFRELTTTLRNGGHVLLLADVRMRPGIIVPFLGRDAMTTSAPANLCRKYGTYLVPVRTERIGPSRYRVTVEEPRLATDTGDRIADAEATMTWVNQRIEEWIRARPEQWFWLHRRWGKNLSKPES